MDDQTSATPEQKLDRILELCERMERYDRRGRTIVRLKWFFIIFLLIAVPGGGWYLVTHVDDMIQNLANRVAVSVSDQVGSRITGLGDTLQGGVDAAADGGTSVLERVRGLWNK